MSFTLDLALAGVAQNNSFSNPEAPLLQQAWDSTSLGQYKNCPRKYFYTNILGFSINKTDPLVFGIAFHTAMQYYHYARAEGLSHDDGIKAALRAGIRDYVADENAESPIIYTAEQKERSLYALLRAICWYLDYYTDNGQAEDICKTILLEDGAPAAELSFRFVPELELPEDFTEPLLCGHLDHVVEQQGSVYVKDYKTTKQLSSRFFNQFNPDNQMSLYTLAGNVVFGLPVKGVIIDGVQLAVHFARFQRGYSFRTPEHLDDWLADTAFWLNQAAQSARLGHWPQNDKACNLYAGCEFREVCQAPKSLQHTILKSNFQRRIWDPLQTREL